TYAEGPVENRPAQLTRLKAGAVAAKAAGLLCHAGHGLSYDTVGPVAAFPEVTEVSIGHFLISQSVFEGLGATVARFRAIMDAAPKGKGNPRPSLTIDGSPLAYVEAGSGPPLLMIHGTLGDQRSWSGQMEAFGAGHHAMAISLRHCWPGSWE